MRAIFGLAAAATSKTVHQSGDAATTARDGDQGDSSPIKPDHP